MKLESQIPSCVSAGQLYSEGFFFPSSCTCASSFPSRLYAYSEVKVLWFSFSSVAYLSRHKLFAVIFYSVYTPN